MASVLVNFKNNWNYLFYEVVDERTRGWFLTGSPIPILTIMFIYNRLVLKIGPEYMKNRKPYKIDRIIQVYNLIQVVLNGWLAYQSFKYTYGSEGDYSWVCQPMDVSNSAKSRKVVLYCWIYYMVKLFDLLDTIFFIMRKKFNQVSFLHVYHHTGVLVLGYMGSTYYPDGQGVVVVFLNSFVHSVMYAYYFLTNYNSDKKKTLWWKKHLTQMQIVQFLILIFQWCKALYPGCNYPFFPIFLLIPQNFLILYLFCSFYKKNYLDNNKYNNNNNNNNNNISKQQ